MNTPLLWHIPLSHYNEKVRWALDFKGIEHRRRGISLDYLVRNWRATGQGKTPILWLDGEAVSDSTRIIAVLEERYPQSALYPADPAARAQALAVEEDLDETLGPALRAAVMTPLFRHDPEIGLRVLMTGMPRNFDTLRRLLPIFPAYYRWRHHIRDGALEQDRATVAVALDRIESMRQGRPYLVGDAFSVADLTAAALMSPLLQPPEIQYPIQVELPSYLQDYRVKLLQHPAMHWALGIYRAHRGQSMEEARRRAA